jgi:hypothetical protein
VIESLKIWNGIVFKKLVSLKNPVERVGAVERKEANFGWFNGVIGRRGR